MNDMNDQMMNFRKSLGLDEPETVKVVKEKSGKATSEPERNGVPDRVRDDAVQRDGEMPDQVRHDEEIAGRVRDDAVRDDGVQRAAKAEVKRNPGEAERGSLAGGRTTITIPAELLGKMKLLSFWMTREGLRRNMSMSQMVWEMFECYLDSLEGARGFVEKNTD